MKSQITKQHIRSTCFLLLLLLNLTTTLNTCVGFPTQDSQEQSSEEPSASEDNIPEVVRTLAELQKLQHSHGFQTYKVDLEAQLIFAAPYWTVFFVQDGDLNAMVTCTDAASWMLIEQNVGCKLRIVGIAGPDPANIAMSSLEVVDPSQSIEPTSIADLTARYSLPLNTLVELSSETLEIFVSRHGTLLYSMVGKIPVELEINDPIDVKELLERCTGSTIAYGCLSLPPEPERQSTYVLRIMNKAQLRSAPSVSSKQKSKRLKVHSGKVVYSNASSEFAIETDNQIRLVHSRFAFRVAPGDQVLIHESLTAKKGTPPSIQSNLIELLSNEPLGSSKQVSITELLSPRASPSRVSLTANVISMESENGVLNMQLRSEGVDFSAAIRSKNQSLDALGIRAGDLISITGAPLHEQNSSPSEVGRTIKLFVASDSDLKFVSTPTRVPLTEIATIALVGCALLGSALTWNWLLRRQVQLRTARLNEVTSHLRKAFDAVHEGVLVNDREQRISGFNQQFAKLFGTQPAEGSNVNTQLDAIEDQLINRAEFARIRQHIHDHQSPSTGILELRSANRTMRVFASAITDTDGSYQGNLWSFEDITEKLSLENKLIQSQKMEAVGQLSGGIAHDFNNLLTIIRGSLMMMKLAAETNAPSTEFAESAEIAVDRAAELTQHLLDFSRRSTLRLQTIDANVLLKRVYLMIRRSIDSSIDISFTPTAEPTFINVDVTRLEQVLINLCINARDALPPQGGRIQLAVRRLETEKSVNLVVEDNGCGISREVQQRMFEPFFTTKQPGCGTGLGLSMAIGVVEQLGGRIECRSELGSGTAFQITLPLIEPVSTSANGSTTGSTAHVRPLRILLVDDEEQIRRLGDAILKSLGHQAVTAANGREAINVLERDQNFDAVLLDLTMPIMSGKEAFQEIRRRWTNLPIAICSGYLVSVDDWVSEGLGAAPSILAKPYQSDQLNAQLASLVRSP